MRIRKFAGNILGTGQYNPWQPPAVINCSTDVYVCILNQDTWDLYSSHPFTLPPSIDMQEMKEGRKEDEMKTIEPMSVVSSTGPVSTDGELFDNMEEEHDSNSDDEFVALRKLSDHIEEESHRELFDCQKKEHQSNPNPYTFPVTKWFTFPVTKGKRSTRKKKKNFENSIPLVCKKTDGKKWRCRRLAHYPNTWCEHHLQQVRSYGKNSQSVAVAASSSSKRTRQKMVRRPATAWAESDIYYYYSDFGPWRSKRVGGDIALHRTMAAKTAEEKLESVEENCNVMDTGDQDWEVEEKHNRKKKVKLRSLESLL